MCWSSRIIVYKEQWTKGFGKGKPQTENYNDETLGFKETRGEHSN